MKKSIITLLLSIFLITALCCVSFAQQKNIVGKWEGTAIDDASGGSQSITLHVIQEDGALKGELILENGSSAEFSKMTIKGNIVEVEILIPNPAGDIAGESTLKFEKDKLSGNYELANGESGYVEFAKVKDVDIAGTWEGPAYLTGQTEGNPLTLIIKKGTAGYEGTITDSFGYVSSKLSKIVIAGNELKFNFEASTPDGTFEIKTVSTIKDNVMTGKFESLDGTTSGTHELTKK